MSHLESAHVRFAHTIERACALRAHTTQRLRANSTFVVLIGLSILGTLLALTSRSAEFPWVDPSNTQLILFRDPQVDFATRIEAIDRAKHTIDSITYAQGGDTGIGLPILKAFRRAAERGVQGRYVFGKIAARMLDPANAARVLLADSSLKSPGEVVSFGGIRNWLAGLRFTDMVHEKILIIDAGTPDELIWIGGRNNSHHAKSDLDLGILLRRIDPSRPYIGDQIREAFAHTWEGISKVQRPFKPKHYSSQAAAVIERASDQVELFTAEQRAQAALMKERISRPVDVTAPLLPNEVRPGRMRVVNNELLNYLLTGVFGRSSRSRRLLESDILNVASRVVANAKTVYLSIMSVDMAPQLKQAVIAALKNGAEVHLITNSKATHRTQVPLGVPYDMGLRDILELMRAGGKLTVYVLSERLLQENPELFHLKEYLHRKVIVADNHVLTGSDNFNEGSRRNNSEMVVHSDDARLAEKMVELIHTDFEVFEKLSCEQALTDYKKFNLFRRGVNRLFYPLY